MNKSGEIYIIPSAMHDEIAVEWLVVRHNVDDNSILLVAPVDDFFLCGSWDVALPIDNQAQRFVRCGATNWIKDDLLQPKNRTGSISDESLSEVRRLLSDAVRGILNKNIEEVDCDPEYQEHMQDILSTMKE